MSEAITMAPDRGLVDGAAMPQLLRRVRCPGCGNTDVLLVRASDLGPGDRMLWSLRAGLKETWLRCCRCGLAREAQSFRVPDPWHGDTRRDWAGAGLS